MNGDMRQLRRQHSKANKHLNQLAATRQGINGFFTSNAIYPTVLPSKASIVGVLHTFDKDPISGFLILVI